MRKSSRNEECETVSDIVQPLIEVLNGPNHPLKAIFDKDPDKWPVIVSIGHMKVPHKNTYMSLVIHTKGDKVIKIEAGEPNLKAITIDETKINLVTYFMDEGVPDEF